VDQKFDQYLGSAILSREIVRWIRLRYCPYQSYFMQTSKGFVAR